MNTPYGTSHDGGYQPRPAGTDARPALRRAVLGEPAASRRQWRPAAPGGPADRDLDGRCHKQLPDLSGAADRLGVAARRLPYGHNRDIGRFDIRHLR
jgi:hypothetical protein